MSLFGRSRKKVEVKVDETLVKDLPPAVVVEIIKELNEATDRLNKTVNRAEAVNRELGSNVAKALVLKRSSR